MRRVCLNTVHRNDAGLDLVLISRCAKGRTHSILVLPLVSSFGKIGVSLGNPFRGSCGKST